MIYILYLKKMEESYKINNEATYADFQMFYVKNSSVIVTATEECRVTLIKTVFLE